MPLCLRERRVRTSTSEKVINAIETVIREGKVRTYDLSGSSKTSEVGDAIVSEMKRGW